MKAALVWFRNDLRLHDHEPLVRALNEAETVLPVYCFDPRHFGRGMFGLPKTGPFRTRFLLESIQDLRAGLRDRGSDLVVRIGKPEDILPDLVEQYDVEAIYASAEVTSEEQEVEVNLGGRLAGVPLKRFWGHTLYHPDETPYFDRPVPDVYTQFRKQVEKHSSIRSVLAVPDYVPALPEGLEPGDIPSNRDLGIEDEQIDPRAVLDFRGGEQAGRARVRAYIWDQDLLKKYKVTRNGMLGPDYSSKFSPWLALGCVSPRWIYEEVKAYEAERVRNKSTYWLVFELIWRDFFRFAAVKYGDALFHAPGPMDREIDWRYDRAAFERWTAGKTGFPFVDANMRELNQTGFMSNRGRQNAASFLAHNLGIDWRMGAAWFEARLIDYDVTSNWGNWAYNAGVGNDPRNRYFNIVSQAERYDENGTFMKHWLPELTDVPGQLLPRFHTLSEHEARMYNVTLDEDYPRPMTDLETSFNRQQRR